MPPCASGHRPRSTHRSSVPGCHPSDRAGCWRRRRASGRGRPQAVGRVARCAGWRSSWNGSGDDRNVSRVPGGSPDRRMPSRTKSRSGKSGRGLEWQLSATSPESGVENAGSTVMFPGETGIGLGFRRPRPRHACLSGPQDFTGDFSPKGTIRQPPGCRRADAPPAAQQAPLTNLEISQGGEHRSPTNPFSLSVLSMHAQPASAANKGGRRNAPAGFIIPSSLSDLEACYF